MLCHRCGSPVDGGARSCPNCGAELTTVKRLDLAHSKGLRISQQLKAIRLEAQHFPPGEEIAGRFVLGEMIGRGPFGEVYRATDREIDAEVAVKIFDEQVIRNPRDHEEFLRVTRAARSLTQPNVVRIHDSGVHKDHPWVSMQLLEGLSLRKVLDLRRAKGETFGLEELEPVVTQVTLALQHVSREFPHGDLKPENIIFLPDLIKVTDSFILAALPAETIIPRVKDSAYLAPELHTAKTDPDPRADVYSLGTIIGEMMFGPDYTPGAQTDNALAPIDTLIRRATAFDPRERYPNVEALSEDLTAVIDTGLPMQPTPVATANAAPPPPPKAPPPPSAPPAGEVAPDPEAHKATEEYVRGEHDLENHVLTTEVKRDQLPPRRVEETAAIPKPGKPASSTASVPVRREQSPGYGIALAIASFVAVAAVVVYFATRPDDVEEIGGEVVELGDGDAPKAAEVPKETAPTPPPAVEPTEAAVVATAQKVEAATEVALAEGRDGADEEGAEEEEITPQPAEATRPSETTERPAPSPPRQPATVAAASSKEPAATPSRATDCPGGMRLIKANSGNYCIDAYEAPGSGKKPKTGVSWFQAKKACEQKGARLCKLSEWRAACGSRYPYGSKFDADKCNTADEDGFERSVAAAGSFKACRSRSGVFDMVGNVHEWVEEQRIAGGGYESDEAVASCRYSSPKSPTSTASYIGYRCCAEPGD